VSAPRLDVLTPYPEDPDEEEGQYHGSSSRNFAANSNYSSDPSYGASTSYSTNPTNTKSKGDDTRQINSIDALSTGLVQATISDPPSLSAFDKEEGSHDGYESDEAG
jgi:hypothetical protein